MRSLYFTFAATTIGIMLISFLSAFFLSNTYYQHYLKPDNDEKNTQIAKEMSTFIEGNPNVDIEQYLVNIADLGYQLYLVQPSTNGVFYGSDFRIKEIPDTVIQKVLGGETYHGMLQFPRKTFVTGFFANELTNTIGVPITYNGETYALFMRPDIEKLFSEMHLLFGWLFLFTIILSIILVLIGAKYLVQPVKRLSEATKTLSSGDYIVKEIETNRKDELGELTRSFIRMAEKIQQNELMRKEFISNISHDIQSPLSNIKGYSGLLNNILSRDDKGMEYLDIINNETNRISSMTNQLLLLSSLEHEEHMLKLKKYNVGRQITQLTQRYEWKIHESNLMLTYDIPDVEIIADESLLDAVWDNLLSNAIKYNVEFGEVEIVLTELEKDIKVSIKDTGIGLDNEAKKHVFERFYRADSSRSQEIMGSGLGLSIVYKVVELHKGAVLVESNENDNGSIFHVILPKR